MSDLRPMEFGEVLDGAFTMYRRNFGLFLKLSAAVMGLPVAASIYFQLRIGGTPDQTMAMLESHLFQLAGWGLLAVLLYAVASLLLTAGSIHAISSSYLGKTSTLGEALQLGASKIVPLMLVGLGKWLLFLVIALLGGLVLGVVAGIAGAGGGLAAGVTILLGLFGLLWFLAFVYCGYALTTPVVVLEDLASSFDAFGRSWDLTRSFKLKVFFLGLVTILLTQLVPSVFLGALGVVVKSAAPSLEPVMIAVSACASVVLAPLLPCVFTMIYYDLRMRREGFDLQLLGQQLGIS